MTQLALWGTGEPAKRCRGCGKSFPLGEFRASFIKKKQKIQRESHCRACSNVRRCGYRRKRGEEHHRSIYRRHSLKRLYGLTVRQYQEMLAAQGNCCTVCGRQETQRLRGRVIPLCVDHDHRTGIVRGLLCMKCNTMLGKAEDDAKILMAAASYLERHRAKRESA